MTRSAADEAYARHAMMADVMLAPGVVIDETRQRDRRALMLAEARRHFAPLPEGSGSRDGLEAEAHTRIVDHWAFPIGGLHMSDLEPIGDDRAERVADAVAEAVVNHCQRIPR